jgi:hypothetical protein
VYHPEPETIVPEGRVPRPYRRGSRSPSPVIIRNRLGRSRSPSPSGSVGARQRSLERRARQDLRELRAARVFDLFHKIRCIR